MRLRAVIALLSLAACQTERTDYSLAGVDGRPLPATMFDVFSGTHSQTMWSTLHWRSATEIEHQFRYRVVTDSGTADTLDIATDHYLATADARAVYLSRYAPAGMHSPDSVIVTDTLERDGADVIWREVLRLGDGAPTDTFVTRKLRFRPIKRR